jgi:hypothetical protein
MHLFFRDTAARALLCTGKVKNIPLPLLLLYTFLVWCLYPGTTFFYSAMNLSPAKSNLIFEAQTETETDRNITE